MGDILRIDISALAHDGRGIGFLKENGGGRGKAVFVPNCFPGQTVACIVSKDRKNFLEAGLLNVEAVSEPDASFCGRQAICGGCPWQAMPYSAQLPWKERLVLDAMRRIGKYQPETLANAWGRLLPSPAIRDFRNKLRLAFGLDADGRLALGFYRRASHEVFNLLDCPICSGAAEIAQSMRRMALASGLPVFQNGEGHWRGLILRKGARNKNGARPWHIVCLTNRGGKHERRATRLAGEALLKEHAGIVSFSHEEWTDNVPSGRRIFRINASGEELALELGGRLFELDPASFFQVNDCAAQKLAAVLLEMSRQAGPGSRLLDLYCGVGAPGLLLAGQYQKISGIEFDARAIAYARKNAAAYAHAVYSRGDAAALMAREKGCDAVLLDPPRSGLSARALKNLLDMAPRTIFYISCNPATLARDAAALARSYELAGLSAVDMFPHTPHVETCGLWIKRRC